MKYEFHCNRCDFDFQSTIPKGPGLSPCCQKTGWMKQDFFCYRCEKPFRSSVEEGPDRCPHCSHLGWDTKGDVKKGRRKEFEGVRYRFGVGRHGDLVPNSPGYI